MCSAISRVRATTKPRQGFTCPSERFEVAFRRAREALRGRIVRRGIALPAGVLAANLSRAQASAGVPAYLVASTVSLAKLSATHAITAATASTVAIDHARRLGSSFVLSSVGKTGIAVLLVGVIAGPDRAL